MDDFLEDIMSGRDGNWKHYCVHRLHGSKIKRIWQGHAGVDKVAFRLSMDDEVIGTYDTLDQAQAVEETVYGIKQQQHIANSYCKALEERLSPFQVSRHGNGGCYKVGKMEVWVKGNAYHVIEYTENGRQRDLKNGSIGVYYWDIDSLESAVRNHIEEMKAGE